MDAAILNPLHIGGLRGKGDKVCLSHLGGSNARRLAEEAEAHLGFNR
jgi:hypothetical protein